MRDGELKNRLAGKYIICTCEGNAEEAVIDLLLDHDMLCFSRRDLVRGKCTQIRRGSDIVAEYLCQAFERDIVILRILDRDKEKFRLPPLHRHIPFINVVTRPEIEILHIRAVRLGAGF